MQDAELRLVTQDPKAPGTKPVGNSGSSSGGTSSHGGHTGDGVGDDGAVAIKVGGGGQKGTANEVKEKKQQKRTNQPGIKQRGPLLITHTGEV